MRANSKASASSAAELAAGEETPPGSCMPGACGRGSKPVTATAASLSSESTGPANGVVRDSGLSEGSGSSGGGGRAGEVEALLGTIEDKLASTQAQLYDCRRLSYFPAAEGYRLRFSYKEMYIGFKDLLLERVRPGTGAVRVIRATTESIAQDGSLTRSRSCCARPPD